MYGISSDLRWSETRGSAQIIQYNLNFPSTDYSPNTLSLAFLQNLIHFI